MQNAKLFKILIDYIDTHIKESPEMIKKQFAQECGQTIFTLDTVFHFVAGYTLTQYIRKRKLYFAYLDLQFKPEMSICELALEYGYSDQAAFTNAFRKEFNITPNHAKLSVGSAPDNRCDFNSLFLGIDPQKQSLLDKIYDELDTYGALSGFKLDYLIEFSDLSKEFDCFDWDICHSIAELSEKLDVPMRTLFQACSKVYMEINSDPMYLPSDAEVAIDLGLSSSQELDEICQFHDCEYYDLDFISVAAYQKRLDIQTYLILLQTYHLSDADITPEIVSKFRKWKLQPKKGTRFV